jgi:hypothetical protein
VLENDLWRRKRIQLVSYRVQLLLRSSNCLLPRHLDFICFYHVSARTKKVKPMTQCDWKLQFLYFRKLPTHCEAGQYFAFSHRQTSPLSDPCLIILQYLQRNFAHSHSWSSWGTTEYEYDCNWGWRSRRPLQRDHFLIDCAFPIFTLPPGFPYLLRSTVPCITESWFREMFTQATGP